MKLTWYGHSCFGLESVCGTVVFDPYEDGFPAGLRLPPLTADLVLCSHEHGDHNAREKVTLTGREPECEVERLFTWHDGEGGRLRGANTVHIVAMEGFRIAHLGDLGHELPPGQVKALGRIDALLVPVGGHYTIDAAAARRVADAVGATLTIPMHYRGEGFGFDVLGTVGDFTRLCGDVAYAEGDSVTLAHGGARQTLVMKLVN